MLTDFRLLSGDVRHIGNRLQRPETVETRRDGSLWACDARGFVCIARDGSQTIIGAKDDTSYLQEKDVNIRMSKGMLPTGFSFDASGGIVFAAYGARKICRMAPSGEVSPFLSIVDGVEMSRPNAVVRDRRGHYWITVSTRDFDWAEHVLTRPEDVMNGFVVRVDEGGSNARIVADGLQFANACRLDRNEQYLYVIESFGQRIVRFRISDDGGLTDKEQYGPVINGPIDGLAFDENNNLWITQPMLERLLVMTPNGDVTVVADFGVPAALERYEGAISAGIFDFNLAAACASPELGGPTSIAFGGEDLQMAFIGSVFGDRIAYFRSPVRGLQPIY